jgi:threonine aldolase
MRQVGILAAAGLYALDHNISRLSEDHANARLIAERLVRVDGVKLDLGTVMTNIVVFRLAEEAPDAATVLARTKEKGVLVAAFAPRKVRLAAHLNVNRAQCEHAADVLARVIQQG